MKDRLWQAVYHALRPLLNDDDVVTAPRGDWPTFPCAAIFYDDLIDLEGCTVLVLHKGQLTSLPKSSSSASPRSGNGFLPTKFSSCSVALIE